MKQCFGYVRVSSLKQGEGVSLDAQKDAILRFAETADISITKWFEEQQTAAKSGRPEFNRMLKALKGGKADGVVMHKIDRGARNYDDWSRIGKLADHGIEFHFAAESLDLRTRGGRLSANIQMAVAEDYVRNLRAEIFKGQRGQLERGFYPFSAPIGYLNNGGRQLKTIDPVMGPLVKLAFELYGNGQYSIRSLLAEITQRGLRGSSGRPISKCCLERFLSNPFYTGVIHIRKTGAVYQGSHEPLISPALFETVQRVKAGKYHKKVTRHNHLFRGLFSCGHCGRSMIPERQKGYVYYRCQYPECPRNSVREERLAEAVSKVLEISRFDRETIMIVEHRVKAWVRAHVGTIDPKTFAMRLAKIDERIEKLEDAAIDEIIDKATFDRKKQKLLLEKAGINKQARDSAEFHQNPAVIAKFLERVKSLAGHYDFGNRLEKREIVEIAVSNRTVSAKTVSTEPSNWLMRTHTAVHALSCGDARSTSRTSSSKTEAEAIRELAGLARSPEAEKLFALFMDGYKKAAFGKRDYKSNPVAA